MTIYGSDKMSKSKKNEKKDNRMVAEYFENLAEYIKKYGEKTILLWQCGSFYEIYSTQDPRTKDFLFPQFNDFLNITHMRDAGKNLNYSVLLRHLLFAPVTCCFYLSRRPHSVPH